MNRAFKKSASSSQAIHPRFLRLDLLGESYHRLEIPLKKSLSWERMSPTLDSVPGYVMQSGRYCFTVFLLHDDQAQFTSALLTINGEEIWCSRASNEHAVLLKDEVMLDGYELDIPRSSLRPFNLVCGYARMSLELFDEAGSVVMRLVAKDVLCQQDAPLSAKNVSAMVEALSGDPKRDKALGWMLSEKCTPFDGSYSLAEGGYAKGAPRSVASYLAIIEAGLDAAKEALPFLRSHAASRITRQEHVIKSSQVRRMGTSEVRWILRNPSVLQPVSASRASLWYQGHPYIPSKVSTSRAFRSVDVYENRICMGFLLSVIKSLTDFESRLQRDIDEINPFRGQAGQAAPRNLMSAMAGVLQADQRSQFGKAAVLRTRALRLLRLYKRILPGVTVRPLSGMRLIRTKKFKEIQAYSRLFLPIERFLNCGESPVEFQGLALSAFRLDRAYETYVLYRILRYLIDNGFTPATSEGSIYAARYGYTSTVFADAPPFANVYHLKRAGIQVDIYYEPVIFSDDREAHGMTLRRLRGSMHSVYTPDYVVVVRHLNVTTTAANLPHKQVFVLDAKYRSRHVLLNRYVDERGKPSASVFTDRVENYLLNMVDAQTGRIPDGLWLLSGLEDDHEPLMSLPALPWGSVHVPACPSGIALVIPGLGMNGLFEAMGIFCHGGVQPDLLASAASPHQEPPLSYRASGAPAWSFQEAFAPNDPFTPFRGMQSTSFGGFATPAPSFAVAQDKQVDTSQGSLPSDAGAHDKHAMDRYLEGESKKRRTELLKEEQRRQADRIVREKQRKREEKLAQRRQRSIHKNTVPKQDAVSAFTASNVLPEIAAGKTLLPQGGALGINDTLAKPEPMNVADKAAKKTSVFEPRFGKEDMTGDHSVPSAIKTSLRTHITLAEKTSVEGIETLVLGIISFLPKSDIDSFFYSDACREILGIAQPLLRRSPQKNYFALSGHDDIYFYYSKLPTYAHALERYVTRLEEISRTRFSHEG